MKEGWKEEVKREMKTEVKTPIKAIRAYCLDCMGGSSNEVKLCPSKDCFLWAYRFGKNPFLERRMSEEQKKAAAERMKAGRVRKIDSVSSEHR